MVLRRTPWQIELEMDGLQFPLIEALDHIREAVKGPCVLPSGRPTAKLELSLIRHASPAVTRLDSYTAE